MAKRRGPTSGGGYQDALTAPAKRRDGQSFLFFLLLKGQRVPWGNGVDGVYDVYIVLIVGVFM